MKGKRVFYALCFLLMSYIGSAQTILNESFDSYPPDGWIEFKGILDDTTSVTGTTSTWGEGNFGSTGSNKSAEINLFGTSKKEWFASPVIDLGNAGNYILEFDIALTKYNNINSGVLGDDDTVAIVISTDTVNWCKANVIKTWTANSVISNTGQHVVLSLAAFTGDVRIGFYAESTEGNEDNDIFIDNVVVKELPATPVFVVNPDTADFGSLVINTSETQIFNMMNLGLGTINIAAEGDIQLIGANSDMFSLIKPNTFPVVLNSLDSETFSVTYNPTTGGAHEAEIQITDDLTDQVHTIPLYGTSIDPTWVAPKLENFDLATTPNLPIGWMSIVSSISSYANVNTYSSSTPNSDPNHLRLYNSSDTSAELVAITPTIADFANRIKFYAKSSSAGQELYIGTISDLSVDTVFNPFDTISLTDSYSEYTIDFSSYLGSDTRIAFKHSLGGTYKSIYIDDIVWEAVPVVPIFAITPDSVDFGEIQINFGSASQDFVMANNGPDTIRIASANDIALTGPNADMFSLTKPDTYPIKLYGTNEVTLTVNYTPTVVNIDTAYLQITDDVTDEVHIIKITGEGADFTITPEYTQDFEGDFPPAGWVNDGWTAGTEAHGGAKCARVSYSHAGEAYLQTPPIEISNGQIAKFWWKDDDISTTDGYRQFKGQKANGGTDIDGHDTTFFEVRLVTQSEWTTLVMLSASSPMANYEEAVIDLSAYAGETVYFRWRDVTNSTTSAYGTGVDDFSIEELPNADVAAVSIDMAAGYGAGNIAAEATVANQGLDTQTFDVSVTINDGSSDVFTNTQTVTGLAYNQQEQITFDNWSATAGSYTVTIATLLTGDENTSNDTQTFDIFVEDNLLWGNNIDFTASTSGIISTDLHGITPDGLVETADDFIVPAGEIWKVDSIVTNGFTNSPTPEAEGYGVKIYADNSGTPGDIVFEEVVMSPVNGLSSDHQQLAFSESLVLGEGTYWVTVYGYYSTATTLAEGRWNWKTWGNLSNNESMLRDNPDLFGGGTAWGPLSSLIGAGAESTDFSIWGVQANDDASLSDLTVDGTTVSGFSSSTYAYNVELPFGTTEVPTVDAATNDANAAYVVNAASSLPGTTEVVVTAEDGTTELTYEINFTLAQGNNDATLSDLTVDGSTVADFDPATLTYLVLLAPGTTEVPTVDATTNDVNAEYVVNAATTLPSTTEVVVTAEDGTTELTYEVEFEVDGNVSELFAKDLNIYPNPSNGIFFIEMDEEVEIAIMDINGKVVYQDAIKDNKTKVDISNNPAGSYIIMVTNGKDAKTISIQLK